MKRAIAGVAALLLAAVALPAQTLRDRAGTLELRAAPGAAGLLVIARPPFHHHTFQGLSLHFDPGAVTAVLPIALDGAGRWTLPYDRGARVDVVLQCLWLAGGKPAASQALRLRRNTWRAWSGGPGWDERTWPVGVWLQSPSRADAYRAIGINLYVGLWKGPTESQLGALAARGMPVLATQNKVGLTSPNRSWIRGWTHQDEPDNAQWNPVTKKYDPPVTPAVIRQRYEEMRRKDPTRPVYLNFGVGLADEKWIGRGTRTGRLEDYPHYIKGADIVSFDIYPIASPPRPEIRGRLEYVARGVRRLAGWAREKPVWNWIEAAGIKSGTRPTPAQIRSEVWMSIIAGATGTMYFVHEFKPRFIEHTVLVDPVLKAGVTAINARLQSLAPVLNSASIAGLLRSGPAGVDTLVKEEGGRLHLFAVNLAAKPVQGAFTLAGVPDRKITVLDENRALALKSGRFTDSFGPYQAHLYRFAP